MEYSKEAPEQWEEVYENIRWSFNLVLIMRALKAVSGKYKLVPGRCEGTERHLLTQWVVRGPTMKMLSPMSEGCPSCHMLFTFTFLDRGSDECETQLTHQTIIRFQCLVSLMLSSQTRDEVIHHWCHRCQPHHGCLHRGELCRNGEAEGARADHREPAQHL